MNNIVKIQRYDYRNFFPDKTEEIINLIDSEGFPNDKGLPPCGFIATLDDKIIGYIGYYLTYADRAFVSIFIVNEVARKLGIGLELSKQLLLEFKLKKINNFEGVVDIDNTEAINYYNRIGLELTEVYLIHGNTEHSLTKINEYESRGSVD